jgi:hypothetical protein
MSDRSMIIRYVASALLVVACQDQEADAAHHALPKTETRNADRSDMATRPARGGSTDTADKSGTQTADADSTPLQAGLLHEDDNMIFRTEEFTLEPGSERYVCWSVRVPEDFKVSAYNYPGRSVVHHFLFYAVANGDEPEGFQACDDKDFKFTWSPLFGAGAGESTLPFPEGVAQEIKQGSQLLVSLHLLNVSAKPVTSTAEVVMTRTDAPDTIPVRMGIMGNSNVNLPPGEATDVVAERSMRSDTRLVGLWAHMHLLGTAMKLEVGPTKDTMEVFYERSPYDFHNQSVDSMDAVIPTGSYTRLTCSYFNDTDQTVTYGESSFNEMCFLLMFTAGQGAGGAVPAF